jgi:Asp-tRNA(Asn)/Glu-tRNA(Gln) amidotransferase C subunit
MSFARMSRAPAWIIAQAMANAPLARNDQFVVPKIIE